MKQRDLKPALREMGFEINRIPRSLYKYTGFSPQDKIQRLNDLRSKKVWLCYAKYLNDPFEGLSLYIDKLKLEAHGWREGDIKTLYQGLKSLGDMMLVGSFAASGLQEDMPLWAHYAYDHKGYCLEYEVIDKTSIYPVLYKNKRHLATKTLSDFLMDTKRLHSTEESIERFLVIWSSFMVKHTVWQYEKEYRILKFQYNKKKGEELGHCLSEKEVGLQLKAIYMGEKCSCKDELMELSDQRRCEIHQMVLNPYQEEFKLIAQKLAISYNK